ncbi:hypothetical protein [Candidatus Poriferisodalis sp.]|uniref:hypothetical protein n=1 Tax=Candidatus Poriferisodalis sp. TaxID=3101277 RepID=UPI003D119246
MAEQRRTTMVGVVTDPVHLLGRDEWWSLVRNSLDEMTSVEVAEYQAGSRLWDAASADGLDER